MTVESGAAPTAVSALDQPAPDTPDQAGDFVQLLTPEGERIDHPDYPLDLSADDIISILFTATPDLTAEFPALAARKIGFQDVPLLCASEINVPGALPRVVRLLMHVETGKPRAALQHVYLRGAAALRLDIAQ